MSDTKTVTGWSLKRAGAGITLTGSSNGCPVRIPDIKTVAPKGGAVIATGKDGASYELRVS